MRWLGDVEEHEHEFSNTIHHGYLTGEPSRECTTIGCKVVSLDFDEYEDE